MLLEIRTETETVLCKKKTKQDIAFAVAAATAASPCLHQLPVVECCWATVHFMSHSETCIAYEEYKEYKKLFGGVPKWRTKQVLQIHVGVHEIWTKLCTICSQDCQELREGCTSQLTGTILASPFTFSSKPSTCQHNVAQKRHSESCQRCHGNGYGRCTTG